MFTIKGKIILSSSIVFSLVLVIFALWIYRSTRQSEYSKLDARLESLSQEMQTEIEEEVNDGLFPDSLDLGAVTVEDLPKTVTQISDTTGKVIWGNSIVVQTGLPIPKSGGITRPYFNDIKINDTAFRRYLSSVEVGEKYPYILQIAVPLFDVKSTLSHLKIMLLISIPLAILFMAIAIYLITALAFRPLSGMANTAQRISASNLNQRLKVPPTSDELHTLSITLNQMFERLEAAFQNQRQFVADASHEIRTPLTIMSAELEFARKMASELEVVNSIDSCLEEIDRLGRMTDSLLLLARLDTSSLPVNKILFRLDELVIEVVQNMMKLAQHRSITIKPYIENALEICSDIDLLRQAMINIIDNAIKYASSGGQVTVSLRSPSMSGNSAVISIKDNGPGISDTDLKKIFKRFFRGESTRKESNGSGLGLPIAQKLIDMLGGYIDIKSEVGKGTEVTIKLP